MARKKIREYDSKRLLKEHYKRLAGAELGIKSAQVTESTDINELVEKEPWLSSGKLVVKPDMLFGKRGKSGLVALNLDLAQVAGFVKERLGKEVEMGGCKGPITTFIVEPFVPHDEEFYLNIVSERLGCSISFSECGGIDIEENWDKVKTIFVPTGVSFTSETCAPLVATLPLEIKGVIEEFLKVVFALFMDLVSHPKISDEAKDLICRLLCDVDTRLGSRGVEEIKAHPWFRQVQWDMLYEMEAAYKPTVTGDLDTQNFEKFADVEDSPSTMQRMGPWRKMLTSKDSNFIGYTFKKSDILKSVGTSGTNKRSNGSVRAPSLVSLLERIDLQENVISEGDEKQET